MIRIESCNKNTKHLLGNRVFFNVSLKQALTCKLGAKRYHIFAYLIVYKILVYLRNTKATFSLRFFFKVN